MNFAQVLATPCLRQHTDHECSHGLRLVWFPDPSCHDGQGEKGDGRKGLVNNLTPTRIYGCIPAVNVDEGKREC